MHGAVEIGDGDAEGVAEHVPRGEVLGHLVDAGGGEDASRAERLEQHADVEQRGEVVRVGVPEVHGDCVSAVLLKDRREPLLDLGQRVTPCGRGQLPVEAHERRAQPVGVVMECAQRASLGAEEPA